MAHPFLFNPGTWLGEGQIRFTAVADRMKYMTRWSVEEHNELFITATQIVEIEGMPAPYKYQYRFVPGADNKNFAVSLRNDMLGHLEGRGIASEDVIAWEFHGPCHAYEGLEIFRRNRDNLYEMRIEFLAPDQSRLIVQGNLWPEPSYKLEK